MHIALCTLHYAYHTMHIALYTLHYTHRTMHIAIFTLHYVHFTIPISLCTLQYAPCTMHIARCTLHYAYCTMNIALCTLHYAHCTMLIALCKLYYSSQAKTDKTSWGWAGPSSAQTGTGTLLVASGKLVISWTPSHIELVEYTNFPFYTIFLWLEIAEIDIASYS